jgi:hypothetical protein
VLLVKGEPLLHIGGSIRVVRVQRHLSAG